MKMQHSHMTARKGSGRNCNMTLLIPL